MEEAPKAESNQKKLLDVLTGHIQSLLHDDERRRRTGERINRVLFKDFFEDEPSLAPQEEYSAKEEVTFRVIQSYFDLAQMVFSVEHCQYYFRRYPFRGLPVSRTDHLRNCCETYFDRIIQFRDRLKCSLNLCKNESVIDGAEVSRILKIFDRVFAWEHKQRNQTHHHARFDYFDLNQLSLAEMVGSQLPSEVRGIINPDRLFRNAARQWVSRIQSRTEGLTKLTEYVAGLFLECPSTKDLQTNDRKAGDSINNSEAALPKKADVGSSPA